MAPPDVALMSADSPSRSVTVKVPGVAADTENVQGLASLARERESTFQGPPPDASWADPIAPMSEQATNNHAKQNDILKGMTM
jgi:hypothetical protein